jgi:hypothetical protein
MAVMVAATGFVLLRTFVGICLAERCTSGVACPTDTRYSPPGRMMLPRADQVTLADCRR